MNELAAALGAELSIALSKCGSVIETPISIEKIAST